MMTQPILYKNTLTIALMTLTQTAMSAVVAVACLLVTMQVSHLAVAEFSTPLTVIIAVSCLILIRPPRDISIQLSLRQLPAILTVLTRWMLVIAVLWIMSRITNFSNYPHQAFANWAIVTAVLLVLTTWLTHSVTRRMIIGASTNRNAVFAGYNEVSLSLAEHLQSNPTLRLQVKGFFDDRSHERLGITDKARLRGKLSELGAIVKDERIDVIFVTLPIRHVKRVMDLLDDLRDTTASIYYVPDIFVFDLIQARFTEIQGMPVVAMCETPFYGYRGIIKRLMDIAVSAVALLLFSPLFIAVAIGVKASSPGPVIFKQRRYGLDGREIAVYKFRSMKVTEDGGIVTQASKSDSRITPVGGFLRRFSLDELPQLINVLQGKMSLVGPRPHAVAHNEQYRKLIKGYMVRHKVLPGITGLAQVSGCRGETSRLEDMEDRIKYDLEYLRHWSPALDLKILLLTAAKIFRDDKAY